MRAGGKPAVNHAPHPIPKHAGVLATPQESAVPEPTYLKPKRVQRRAVGRHSVITNVPTHDRPQPLAHFRDGVMHASFEFGLHLAQLRLQPFANRLPQDREASVPPLLPTDVGEAEEVERLRFPFSALVPVFSREQSELQRPRFLRGSSKLNFRILSISSAQNRTASDFTSKPTTISSANLTMIMSPQPCFRRHAWAHRSNTKWR